MGIDTYLGQRPRELQENDLLLVSDKSLPVKKRAMMIIIDNTIKIIKMMTINNDELL